MALVKPKMIGQETGAMIPKDAGIVQDEGGMGAVNTSMQPSANPVEPPPPVTPPPMSQPNTPLSTPGTFARPGTRAAIPFLKPGQGAPQRSLNFGPGVQIAGGGSSPFAGDEDEMVKQITGYLRG